MSNAISFTGRLGNDSELKEVGQYKVLQFSVANNVGYSDNQKTNWFRCAVWGNKLDGLKNALLKGKLVFVTGELTLNEYSKNDGTKGFSADVKVNNVDFIGSKSDSENSSNSAPSNNENNDDDMPF